METEIKKSFGSQCLPSVSALPSPLEWTRTLFLTFRSIRSQTKKESLLFILRRICPGCRLALPCAACPSQAQLQTQDGRTKGLQHVAVPERQHPHHVAQRGAQPAQPQRQGRPTQPRRGREGKRCT